ncbi:MAG TPA: glycosyl hydrolase 53 family protein [Tepidisphaeraceae bacterium]|jgi:arabinogalactan endo-1,4-beta-galactosidase|nr:glycosyl hydrolase 53 family protein [Tepidisphaeraceae bacterium]
MYTTPRGKRGISSLHLAVALVPLGMSGVACAQDFLMGSDISLLTWEQQEGMTFTDTNGVAATADQILYNHGDNLFRLRIFVNPNTSYSATDGAIQTTAYDIALAQQLKADDPSAKFELDFHYSDTWADPGHQTIPTAWAGESLATLESTVQSYTTTTLDAFKSAGVMPDMVQVGNEINSGTLWPTGQLTFPSNTTQDMQQWQAFGGLLNSAIAGVRAAQGSGPKLQVAITIANGNSSGEPQFFYGDLTNPSYGNVPASSFDIIGVDYYPTKSTDLSTLSSNLTAIVNTYNKPVMVMETDAPWEKTSVASDPAYAQTQAGQEQYLTDLANTVKALPNNDGLGVMYWYPESVQVPGQYDYNGGATALFDNTTSHTATLGVDAFSISQHQWNTSTSGAWETSGNWTNGSPNGAGVEADFFGGISGNQTISISSAITLGTVNFKNANTYTLGGTGSLTTQDNIGWANVVVQSGTQQIDVPLTIAGDTTLTAESGAALQIGGPVTVDAGQILTPAGTGTISYTSTVTVLSGASITFANSTHAQGLTIASTGTAAITGSTGATVLTVDSLSNSGTIDVQNNELIVNYTTSSPASTIRGELASGYNGGYWNGTGIASSVAAANSNYGLGYADGADGLVAGLSSGQVEIKYTLYGDTNLDGTVNSVDFGNMAANFGKSGTVWDQGDFDYDGVVNSIDFGLLAANFGKSASGADVELSSSDWAALDAFAAANGLMSDVPEPLAGGILSIGVITLLSRRRRIRPKREI